MKKKVISLFIMVSLLAMALSVYSPIYVAASDTSTHNDIIVDGVVGADWMDGNYTLTIEDDTGELDSLYLAVNQTGLAVALKVDLTANTGGNLVYFDIDGEDSGISSMNDSVDWNKRNIFFPDGFKPDFFIGGWGLVDWDNGVWELFNTTGKMNVNGTILNETTLPSMTTYEAFIPWSIFYPSGNSTHPVPANAQISIAALRCAGDWEPLVDAIPSNTEVDTIDNHVVLPIDSDGDMKPDLVQPTIGWAGNEYDSSIDEMGVVGTPLDVAIAVWYNSVHEFPNSSAWPEINYRVYDNSTDTWGSVMTETMFHKFGDYQGSNDWHRYSIATGTYDNDDIVQWNISSSYGDTGLYNVTLGPMPPVDIGFVGNIDPSGGFILPDTAFEITVQVELLWDGTETRVTGDLGFDVDLNYTIDDGSNWLQAPFSWDEIAGQNAQYNIELAGFPENTNMTFTINITTNNDTHVTAPITLYILIPPPETEIFYMVDPAGDEYGVYPTEPNAFPVTEPGIWDVLEFNVSANEFGTTFRFHLANAYDPGWGAGVWSHPIFGVMIDIEAGGATTALSNIFANTEADYPWDYGFQIEGWQQKFYTPTTLDDPMTSSTGITIAYEDVGGEDWFSFNVPELLIGAVADSTWKYFIAVGSGDTNEFRAHNAVAEDYKFGGGEDGSIDPNWVDILVPEGGNSTEIQEFITNDYDISSSTMTTLLAVGDGISYVEDATDPLVSITAPADAEEFNITEGETTTVVTLTWTASDPDDATFSGIDRIEVYVDTVLEPTIGGGTVDLTLSAGNHTIVINVYDKRGNYATTTITITVNAAPEEDGGGGIPGYGLFFLLIAGIGTTLAITKRIRK
jgi:hypothetical protein